MTDDCPICNSHGRYAEPDCPVCEGTGTPTPRLLCAEVRRLRDLLRETDERRAELGHQNERLREEAKRLRHLLPVDTAAALLHDWADPA